jgi:hypothetical protein
MGDVVKNRTIKPKNLYNFSIFHILSKKNGKKVILRKRVGRGFKNKKRDSGEKARIHTRILRSACPISTIWYSMRYN